MTKPMNPQARVEQLWCSRCELNVIVYSLNGVTHCDKCNNPITEVRHTSKSDVCDCGHSRWHHENEDSYGRSICRDCSCIKLTLPEVAPIEPVRGEPTNDELRRLINAGLIKPLSEDQITPEIRLQASRCIMGDPQDSAFSKSAHKYAAYTIIRENQLVAALSTRTEGVDGFDEGVEAAKNCAAMFTMKPDRSIHPDIPWDEMNDNAKMVSHTTAQQIAWAISELKRGPK